MTPDWRQQANCKGRGRLFYPADGENRDNRLIREAMAKELCADCPVVEPCLTFALDTFQMEGIWGGTTAYESRALRRGRAS